MVGLRIYDMAHHGAFAFPQVNDTEIVSGYSDHALKGIISSLIKSRKWRPRLIAALREQDRRRSQNITIRHNPYDTAKYSN